MSIKKSAFAAMLLSAANASAGPILSPVSFQSLHLIPQIQPWLTTTFSTNQV
jgi:hypothetical protein